MENVHRHSLVIHWSHSTNIIRDHLLWFEDSPCCPFRSQPITAPVVNTNGVCHSHQSDLSMSSDLLMRYTPHPGQSERPTLHTQTRLHVRRIPSTFVGTIYSCIFPSYTSSWISTEGRKGSPVKRYHIVQITHQIHTCSKPWSIRVCEGNKIRNLQLNQTKTIQLRCRQPLFSPTGSVITLSFYLFVAFINEASHH